MLNLEYIKFLHLEKKVQGLKSQIELINKVWDYLLFE